MIIHIKSIIGETLNTRDEAQLLFSKIIPMISVEEVVLDFSDIIFMSRSFADEFYIEYKKLNGQMNSIIFKNANIQIMDILKAIDNTYKKSNHNVYIEYPKFSFTNYNHLSNYLQAL